jgi:hypothetical protein
VHCNTVIGVAGLLALLGRFLPKLRAAGNSGLFSFRHFSLGNPPVMPANPPSGRHFEQVFPSSFMERSLLTAYIALQQRPSAEP